MAEEEKKGESGSESNLFASRLRDAILACRYGDAVPWDNRAGRGLSKNAYMAGLLVLFICSYGQYLFQAFPGVLGTAFVYGIPLLTTSLLFGRPIIRVAVSHNMTALKLGLGLFGIFMLLGDLLGTLVLQVLALLQSDAVNLLDKPNPVLNVSEQHAWLMVAVSMIVIGPAEEFLFRGFVFGGLLHIYKGHHWIKLAFLSSLIFAAVHLYYALAYGYASLVAFVLIIAVSMGLSATYYLSGGNLLIPALLHGAYDAAGFLGVAVSPAFGAGLRGMMVTTGVVVAVFLAARFRRPIEA